MTTKTYPDLPPTIRRAAHLAQRRLGDEVVVMDLHRGKLYGFNPAGGEILDWLRTARERRELEALGAGVVDDFLRDLVERGLVAAAEPAAQEEEEGSVLPLLGEPRLLWQEEAVRVTNQISPPQAITNPQCQP